MKELVLYQRPMPLPDPLPPAERFEVSLQTLRVAIWTKYGLADSPKAALIWRLLGRIIERFATLVARIQSGKIRPPRLRVAARVATETSATRAKPLLSLGRRWLQKLAPHASALCGKEMYYLLSRPEMTALVAAEPVRMWRIIRPLMAALGWEIPPNLVPPPPPGKRERRVETTEGGTGPSAPPALRTVSEATGFRDGEACFPLSLRQGLPEALITVPPARRVAQKKGFPDLILACAVRYDFKMK